MGQVALGFRSLFIKLAIFFVMAALLAWALGGTLLPRAEIVDQAATTFDGRDWFWRLSVGGRGNPGLRWTLMAAREDADAEPVTEGTWTEVAGPVVTPDALYYAGRGGADPEGSWRLERLGRRDPAEGAAETGTPARPIAGRGFVSIVLPDRLAVERQLARIEAGLPVEDAATVRARRDEILDPPARRPEPAPPPETAGTNGGD